MDANALLAWARGPGLDYAITIFLFGMVLRLLEILILGRRQDLSTARQSGVGPGLRTVITRTLPAKGMLAHVLGGYLFHLGLLIVVALFVPHIQVFEKLFGLGWGGLSNRLVDAITVVTLAAMVFMLVTRLTDPVKRLLSTCGDYLAWALTFLPLLTGYLAVQRLLLPYTEMLAIHLLTVELLLVLLPFTKLTHSFTFILARYYNGQLAGRKGVQS